MSQENPYSAIVAAIPIAEGFIRDIGDEAEDAWDVILNVGADHGIIGRSVFLLFALGPEILDPENGESLGHFEIVRGQAKVTHLQAKMCTVRSTKTVTRSFPKNNFNALAAITGGDTESREVQMPFKKVKVGDFARLIS